MPSGVKVKTAVSPFKKYPLRPNDSRLGFGGSKRTPLSTTDKAIPGPAKYFPNAKIGRSYSAPSYGMGRKHPERLKNAAMPGPGEYRLKDTLNRSGPIMRPKKANLLEEAKKLWAGPAVGQYDPKLPASGRQASFGIGVRPSSAPPYRPSATPMGPMSTLGGGGARFGPPPPKKPSGDAKDYNHPGPGDYVVPTAMRYNIGPKVGHKVTPPSLSSTVPGPGTYPLRSTLGAYRSPSYSISFKYEDRTKAHEGPAPYLLPSAFRYDIGPKIGQKVAPPNQAASVPGPGTYPVPTTLCANTPRFSILAKRDNVTKPYDGPAQLILPSTLTGPQFSFGRQKDALATDKSLKRRQILLRGASDPYDPDYDLDDYPDTGETWVKG